MNTRKRQTPDETRQEIINVAAHLAMEVGLANVTRDAIAGKLGRSQGLISHHFDIPGLRVAVVLAAIEHDNPDLVADALCMRGAADIKVALSGASESLIKRAKAILMKRITS